MPGNRFQWLTRVKSVEREQKAARRAIEFLLAAVRQDPTALEGDLRLRDLDEAAARQEGTYIIRLFAEFETCLRVFLRNTREKRPPLRTRDLLDSVGARRRIPDGRIDDAHAVRDYRNSLVHEREEEVEPIPIDVARSRLCTFLSFLPVEWAS